MGDRNNPIKFGPEWLRNFSTERRTGGPTSSGANTATSSTVTTRTGSSNNTATNMGAMGASGGGAASNNSTQPSNSHHNPKVLLAKLRYGREEMLALYDKDTAEAPACLKYNELLYKPREKPPLALNSTFDEEIRESMRNNQPPPINALDRLGSGRARPGPIVAEGRGRGRLQYYRQSSTGSKRNTNMAANNWRVQTRDDSEEWRTLDSRPRSLQDKRDRNWNERPVSDKNSWNSNRRTWVGGGTQNEENLPEWAVGNAEANPGTFDSSGAFHGYSNDDSSILKNQEPSYQLTRSHTHGSFARSKTEDGSEEWWTSEKANKLSAKKFDASEVKFKRVSFKQPLEAEDTDASPSTSADSKSGNNKEDNAFYDNRTALEKDDKPNNASKPPESNSCAEIFNPTVYKPKYSDSKTLDELMMSDMNSEETDERSNFQSVLIAPNNSLRQKHQNIVSAESDLKKAPKRGYLQMLHRPANQQPDEEEPTPQSPEDKLVDEIFDMTLDEKNHQIAPTTSTMMMNSSTSNMSSGMSVINSMAQISNPNIQMGMPNSTLTNPALLMNASSIPTPGIHSAVHQLPIVQRMNSNLNTSMGLQMEQGNGGIRMGVPLHGVAHNHPMGPNSGMLNTGMGPGMQPQGIIGFPPSSAIPPISSADSNKSLFLGQNLNNSSMPTNDIPLPNHGGQSNMFSMHGLQQRPVLQSSYGTSLYTNIMRPPPTPTTPNPQNMAEQWYYEDPKKITQGPFSSKEMYTWYRAGFFGPSLMVRRSIDTHMRPLGSYGPVVPFAQDLLSPFPLAGFDTRPTQAAHDSMLNSQNSLGMDNMMNMGNLPDPNTNLDSLQFPSVGRMNNPPFAQQPMDYPWSQPTSSADLWMQQMMEGRNESRVNNLPMFFWDHQQLNSLPQPIKEMKTEDQILAQIKANQNISTPSTQSSTFFNDHMPVTSVSNKSEDGGAYENASLSLEELQKLIQTDVLTPQSPRSEASADKPEPQPQVAKVEKHSEQAQLETSSVKHQIQNKATSEPKQVKSAKADAEKTVKNKDTGNTKNKNKNKAKDDKKEEAVELKKDDEVVKTEKRTMELSPTKSKKEEKLNKKDIEKEKKDWIKDGFTIVKGVEKSSKENKKKSDEAKAAEEAEKKRKEEEKLAAEEEKRKRQAETIKRQQEQLLREQHQRQVESMSKKAPWSTSNPAYQAVDSDGLTLAEIQRLEREKKLEQIKEQQQMMQMIAQQQAAALAREQEMQAGLGWAKKKMNSNNMQNQSLAEIQAEARKAAAAATVAASVAQVLEEPPAPLPTINHAPWGSALNGGGFWDAQPNQPAKLPEKPQEFPKPIEQPKKKKVTVIASTKKENSPVSDFESWCTGVLSSWSYKIDVPTFVGFLKDIESPYEVKDYVKCYLGESKESGDFARQFLEKRSKLLRVGMVTPSDDLCSPAAAINPRTLSGSDYQEVKGKGKKTKKNKMLKVDARILGFSVTASEDRINVGDIDTV